MQGSRAHEVEARTYLSHVSIDDDDPDSEDNHARTAGPWRRDSRTKYQGQALRAIRRLHTLFLDYPTDILRGVLATAVEHKAYDLVQVERLVLRSVGAEVFRLSTTKDDP